MYDKPVQKGNETEKDIDNLVRFGWVPMVGSKGVTNFFFMLTPTCFSRWYFQWSR